MNSIINIKQEDPAPSRRGRGRNTSERTLYYRQHLTEQPNQWFVWRETGPSNGADLAIRSLMGLKVTTGLDRKALPYQACVRSNGDGTHKTYVRFVEENQPANA